MKLSRSLTLQRWLPVGIALTILTGHAAEVPGPTLEQLRGYAFPEDLVSSSTGSNLAWSISDHGKRNIWAAGGPDFRPRQLTHYTEDDGQELSSVALAADGSYVVYVRGGDHGANWDRQLPTNPQSLPTASKVEIWSVPFSGGPSHRIGEGDSPVISPDSKQVVYLKDGAAWLAPMAGTAEPQKILTTRGRVQSPVWSPDSKRLAFVAQRETHSFIGIYTGPNEPIRWIAPAFARDDTPRWSPDGTRLAFVRVHGDGGEPYPLLDWQPQPWSIWVADVATGEAKRWWTSGTTLKDSRVDDGLFDWGSRDRILFQSYQDGWPHLYSLATQGGRPLRLTTGNFEVTDARLNADRTQILFDANTGTAQDDADRRHIYEVPVAEPEPRALTSGSGLEWAPVATGDGHVAFISATAQRPPAPALVGSKSNAPRLLTDGSDPAYPSKRLIIPRRVTFTAGDGLEIHGQLFEPPGSDRHPAIVYLHGGPKRQMLLGWHPMAYYSNDYALNQYLATRGFVVLAVNYRLGTHYGFDFAHPAGAGKRGASEYRDVQAAGSYLKQLPTVDATRVGIYGGSYGGYLTAMGLAHNSDLFEAGVDIHGVHDWTAREELSWPFSRKRYEVAPDLDEALETAWKSSPVSAVAHWRSPVLLIQGDDDRNVRFGQSVDLVQRLEQQHVPVESLVFPDDTHEIWLYSNELTMNRATAEFLERNLAGKPK